MDIDVQLAKLQAQFEEHKKNTEAQLADISADVKTLIADQNQRVGAERTKKVLAGFLLVAIPSVVSAATAYFFHR